ncbi:MAG: DUF3179 domain-containing protein [Chloroflexi bacterium]|nr:DUF3179 domain-containing protein [Chloroflexota bacterium]
MPLHEISSGGPGKDGIPAIDRPQFVRPAEANGWLKDVEPVVSFDANGEARAYPIQILIWHEIVNDTVGGVPVTVTFCPLCNTAIAFDRRLDGAVYDFGTTGNLRYSDLVMYDRQTESWWQQITGEALVGDLAGKRLVALPASMIAYSDFKTTFPQSKVLSRETGFRREYGANPYVGYDDVHAPPFLYEGPKDGRLPPKERVVTLSLGSVDVAYPFSVLARLGVVNDEVGGQAVAVFHQAGTASALDQAVIDRGRDVGAGVVFDPHVDGRRLTFKLEGGRVRDEQTSSTWNMAGQATSGPLTGKRLRTLNHGSHFFFAWAVFKPHTRIYQP